MAHPKLQLSRLLDWLKLRIECEDTPPTDDQIVAFLGLDSTLTARSMLADLADRGDISIKYEQQSGRQITLGRQHREIETPRPVPSVVKPRRAPISEEECAARIQAIMSLGKPKQPVSPAAEMEAPASGEGERRDDAIVQPVAPSAPVAAPPTFEPKRLPAIPRRGRPRVIAEGGKWYRLSFQITPDEHAELARRARPGDPVGRVARLLLKSALASERIEGDPSAMSISPEAAAAAARLAEAAPTPLFRIPAEVTRAAIRDGIPVLDLAATLMMRGLGSFEQDAAREIAA